MSDENWQPYFKPGERLLWQGAPEPGFQHPWKSLVLILFGLPFLLSGIAVLFYGIHHLTVTAGADLGLGVFVMAFWLPFIGFGGFLALGPVLQATTASRRVRYALSTQAAYIASNYLTRKIEVYPLLPSTALAIEKGRRTATVWFHARNERTTDGDLAAVHSGFRNLADGERVYCLIRYIQGAEHHSSLDGPGPAAPRHAGNRAMKDKDVHRSRNRRAP